jgi:lipoyl(octanoyl) transferase
MRNNMSDMLHTPLPLPLEWRVSAQPVPYDEAVETMKERAAAIRDGTAGELIWLLEHEPIYTAGTSAKAEDLLNPGTAMIRETGRGGEWTYHGPGQRIVYILLDVAARGHDLRRFVHQVEAWSIAALAKLDITATRRQGYPGVWVEPQNSATSDKITAIGIRLSKWVSWHGMAINRAPDLEAFAGIVPCGIHDGGVTSIKALGKDTDPARLDLALKQSFNIVFGEADQG